MTRLWPPLWREKPRLHDLALRRRIPRLFKSLPPTHWLLAHFEITHYKVVVPIVWQLAFVARPTHGNVDQQSVVLHPSRPTRYASLHYWPAIDVPHKPASPVWDALLLDPCKSVCMRPRGEVWQRCLHDTMLLRIFAIVVPPV